MGTEYALVDFTAKEMIWLGKERYDEEYKQLYQIDDYRIVHFIIARHGHDLRMVNDCYPGEWDKFKEVDTYGRNGLPTSFQLEWMEDDTVELPKENHGDIITVHCRKCGKPAEPIGIKEHTNIYKVRCDEMMSEERKTDAIKNLIKLGLSDGKCKGAMEIEC